MLMRRSKSLMRDICVNTISVFSIPETDKQVKTFSNWALTNRHINLKNVLNVYLNYQFAYLTERSL